MEQLLESPWFTYAVLPALIFLARVADVSIGTLRIVFVGRGHKMIAMLLGFFEVIIWLLAIGQIMTNLTSIQCYLAYAAGFAAGNYVGLAIEQRLAPGTVAVRVICRSEAEALTAALRQQGFGVTRVEGQGRDGPVAVLYIVVKRRRLQQVLETIWKHNPKAFYSVKEVRTGGGGTHPVDPPRFRRATVSGGAALKRK